MRSSSGGCVLKSAESVSEPNKGLTMHSAEVVGRQRRCWDALVIGAEFLQGANQPVRLANHAHAGGVGRVFPLP